MGNYSEIMVILCTAEVTENVVLSENIIRMYKNKKAGIEKWIK